MKIIKFALIFSSITVILAALIIKAFPEWLTILVCFIFILFKILNWVLGAGGKIKSWDELLEKKSTAENLAKEVNLTIIPQIKIIDENIYIIINVINNENKAVFCRVEVNKIYGKTDGDIKREITQYANLLSWSGGSQNGIKEILAGLDGTLNLVVRRTNAYGIYFLFHENPDTNWKKAGVYKLELKVKGTIGGNEFLGKRMTINFEYIEKEERDSYGSFFNRGELKLLKWSVAKNAT